MQKILEWRNSAVMQKEPTGCIPTGYEFLIRNANITNVDFSSFQDSFDLNKSANNGNFISVARAISSVYPSIKFEIITYGVNEGSKKLNKIVELISADQAVLISLNTYELTYRMDWHIMPVIGIWNDALLLLNFFHNNGIAKIIDIPFNNFVEIHKNNPGGNDIAYLL